MIKPKTIQAKLFFSYSVLIVGIIITFVVSYYLNNVKVLESKSSESIRQLSDNISSQLDVELKNMNTVSDKFLFTSLFSSITNSITSLKDLFYSDASNPDINTLNMQRQFNDILYASLGPQLSVPQINIFGMSGYYIGAGNSTSFGTVPSDDIIRKDWVKETLKCDGSKLILPPHKDDFGNIVGPVISLCRAFSPDWGSSMDSIIEVQQNYDIITGIIAKAMSNPSDTASSDKKVYVFDQSGQAIYPYPIDGSNFENIKLYWEKFKNNKASSGTKVINIKNSGNEIAAYSLSEFSGWIVMIVEPEKALLQPVTAFRNNTLILGIIVILLTLAVSYFVSKGLTIPIKRIHKSIKGLQLETLNPTSASHINSGLNELEELNMSFIEMCGRLKFSLDEVVSSRSHEIQARMLALQSQMNPHFLYNTLTIISIMAENEGNANIVKVCDNLSSMLRYISSDNSSLVTINQEIEHTISFLNLMKIRYGDNLIVNVQIPGGIAEVSVPRLIIEPLVENCTKYGLTIDPPWKISIEGKLLDGKWMVSVRDNGLGFDKTKIDFIREKLASIDPQKAMPKLELDGMGLMNIFIRLRLLYGMDAIFELSNHSEGGAVVTIGGPVLFSEEVK